MAGKGKTLKELMASRGKGQSSKGQSSKAPTPPQGKTFPPVAPTDTSELGLKESENRRKSADAGLKNVEAQAEDQRKELFATQINLATEKQAVQDLKTALQKVEDELLREIREKLDDAQMVSEQDLATPDAVLVPDMAKDPVADSTIEEGVMQTHDEETKKFFKHSSVHCVLAPRYASNKLSIFKQQNLLVQVVGTLFTHHQKCVVLDTQASGNNRKITAFIGGLDLCDGRYDTPEHRLFGDLDTVFKNDFHNPTFPSCVNGPRQPWHDLHCKIEGPAAYDILTNFEQRWRKTKWRDFRLKKVTKWHDDSLIKIDRLSWMVTPSSGPDGDHNVRVSDEKDPENWHVQVFRSIDSGSVKGFPKGVHEAEAQKLVCAKNLKVDKSIHAAYVKAIRSAQHFIYIENQYFIGSSYYWPSYKNAGADNLIPMELALKIASKISANESFAVYIVIPLWPEGVPTSASVQEILFWQGQTMAMMYKIVAQALEKAGLSDQYHPRDYLNFYCLGKREASSSGSSSQRNQETENHALAAAQKFGRFMIYVHAKGMIVDDEYIIMGSANINQRSLDGSRDTEIAMGAYQPNYTWAGKNSHPHGQVYGYRMSLWAEHLCELEDTFHEPQSIECVRHVNKIATYNWEAFVAEEEKEMKGNLMLYPIQVSRDGNVNSLSGNESFPDVGGKILGAPTNLPDVLTT
ncbi:phospholipase D delta-like [Quercus lobata]|uniref:phospholipase D delta-like n=1 Tax=Quercus lobata TaxID=97700 RepID=UPI001247BDC4|nr:phospholipase D delta-like [Quercus lobata]